jgi:hypothetical protein
VDRTDEEKLEIGEADSDDTEFAIEDDQKAHE